MAMPLHSSSAMLLPRLLFATAVVTSTACGGRYRTELVGQGHGSIAARGSVAATATTDAVTAPGAGGIQLPQGTYDLALRFDIPRAQLLDWKLVCPGVELTGQVGEPFEAYRERRQAELTAQVERDRARGAAATTLLIEAIAPPPRVQGGATIVVPGGRVRIDARAPLPVTPS
ncbi:MAG: hypothetical protein M3680_20760, partial [Myxococcota bacterium]|nr:hypothetical protein [Myxococcota bacterium]